MGWSVFRGEGLGSELVSGGNYFPREGMTFAKVPKEKKKKRIKRICKV